MAKQGEYTYDWPRAMNTCDAAVFRDPGNKNWQILLILRAHDPFKGLWAIPGGFLEMNEELLDCAIRELAEETSLGNVTLWQLKTYGTIGRDPRGRQITTVYMGIVDYDKSKVAAGDDAANAKWFNINDLPQLAFDHKKVLAYAIGKLK